eukprot:gene9718-biopygen9220
MAELCIAAVDDGRRSRRGTANTTDASPPRPVTTAGAIAVRRWSLFPRWRKGIISYRNPVKHVGTIWDTKEYYFTHRSAFKTTRDYPRPQTDDKVLWWLGTDRKDPDRIAAVRVCLLDELDDQPPEVRDSVAKDYTPEEISYFRSEIVPDRPPPMDKSRDNRRDGDRGDYGHGGAGRRRERDRDEDRRRDRDRDDATWRRERDGRMHGGGRRDTVRFKDLFSFSPWCAPE